MRAALPVESGRVSRAGARIGFETFGEGRPDILLLPTWTIIHSRFWKMQVPYLSRTYRVTAYDAPGNGLSDRVVDPERHSGENIAADGLAVMDHLGIERAVLVGLSLGAHYAVRLAREAPDRVAGIALIGPTLGIVPPIPERAAIGERIEQPYPENPKGWEKYNISYWHDHYADFAQFFFSQAIPEPHSTKPIEDAVGWALETTAAVLEAEAHRPPPVESDREALSALDCPVLVIHGTEDRIQPHAVGAEAARLTGGNLVSLGGSGHMPNVRDPVTVNLLLRRFVEGLAA